MSSQPLSFVQLIKNFAQYPNPDNENKLSEFLKKIVGISLEEAYQRKEKKFLPRDEVISNFEDHALSHYYTFSCYQNYLENFEVDQSDYHPYAYYYIFMLVGDEISLSKKKLDRFESVVRRMNHTISTTWPPQEEDTKCLRGWIFLSAALKEIKNLKPLLHAHQHLEESIYLLKAHANSLKDEEAKKTGLELAKNLRDESRQYLGQVYYLYKDPDQKENIEKKTKEYKEKTKAMINSAIPILKNHRGKESLRIITKIMLAISALCTLGLALMAKGIYSFDTTNKFTVFHDLTRSHGLANQIEKSVDQLTKKVPKVCA